MGARALPRRTRIAATPEAAATTPAALEDLDCWLFFFFFLSYERAVLRLSWRDLARCCRVSGPLSLRRVVPAVVLERSAARVMPGAFPTLPQVLPELRERFALWRTCWELLPAVTPAHTPGLSLAGSRISSVPSLRL
ncbi:hypothetical protein HJG60_009892 [Phyllostomus discolor]|uniref:Uncharacterized protein n=1 Tax=Phyllostomus discolor TaxID=89673 RepID=A0A834EQK5_9CHIR|nr:hypothetical protein HJG60_009892 [Phyllostomus discolor]